MNISHDSIEAFKLKVKLSITVHLNRNLREKTA